MDIREELNNRVSTELLTEEAIYQIRSFSVKSMGDKTSRNTTLSYLEMLYELEYKYHKLLSGDFHGNPKRRDNILNIISIKGNQLISVLSESIINVFDGWLEMHDFENPEKFATKRLTGLEEFGYTPFRMLSELFTQYYSFGGKKTNEINEFISNTIFNNKEKYPMSFNVLDNDVDERTDALRDDMRHKLELSLIYFNEAYSTDFKTEDEADDYIIDYDEIDWDSFYSYSNFNKLLGVYPCIEIHMNAIFPKVYEFWEENNLLEIVDKIKLTRAKLINVSKISSKASLSDKFVAFHKALNVTHSSGSIMTYYVDDYGVDESDLDKLSNRGVSDWDKELGLLGVKI